MSSFPYHLPPGAYFDDPAANIDRAKEEHMYNLAVAREFVSRFGEWILRGGLHQVGFRCYIVLCCVCPQLLPCKHPTLAWCARVHGYSRQRASDLGIEFVSEFNDHIQFRGQRFRSCANKVKKGLHERIL